MNLLGKTLFLILILILLTNSRLVVNSIVNVYADDDEQEQEDEENEEDDDDDERYEELIGEQEGIVEEVQEVIERFIILAKTTILNILPAKYINDSDGDKIVDALDFHPYIPEWQFYMDEDNDFVPNIFDKHHGEDDFKFVKFTDNNVNGIDDSFEQL